MTIITKPSVVTKSQAAEFTLNKTELSNHASVVGNTYFHDTTNWKEVIMKFTSTTGNQIEVLVFDATLATPTANFLVSEHARNGFEINTITIMDYDGGSLHIGQMELNLPEFDVAVSDPVTASSSLVSQFSQVGQIASISPDLSVAQSFEFQTAKTISSIDFYLRKNASFIMESTIKMEILKTSDLSLVATSDIVSASAITALSNQDPNAVKFTFPNVAIEANVSYFAKISVVNNVDFFSGTIQVLGDTSNPYPHGNAYYFANGSWNNFSSIDYMFEIFGA